MSDNPGEPLHRMIGSQEFDEKSGVLPLSHRVTLNSDVAELLPCRAICLQKGRQSKRVHTTAL
eukprot:1391656-Amorphochlora_amoeboformis.AAC.2